MRRLPEADPGSPDLRSPTRYVVWLATRQWPLLVAGTLFGILWMASQAALWIVIAYAIGDSVSKGSSSELLGWTAVAIGLGAVQAVSGRMRHKYAVTNWLTATYRTIQLVGRHAARTGQALPATIPSGDVVNTVAADAMRVGGMFDVSARFAGAVVTWLGISIYLFASSAALGAIVLFGVPVLMVLTVPMMRPLHSRQAVQREVVGKLTALGADTVAGLRVLRGLGGEDEFLGRYRVRSDEVRRAGNRVAGPQALLESGQVVLPSLLVAAVTLLTARLVIGGSLGSQQMIAFYGLTAFLTMPLRTATEGIIAATRGLVGARKVIAVLSVEPSTTTPSDPATPPRPGGTLVDPHSGFEASPGRITALVTETPEEAQVIADRLGRFTAPGAPEWSEASLGGTPLATMDLDDVRRRVVVSEVDPRLFSGPLRDELSPHTDADDHEILRVVELASAEDVLDALEAGLDTRVEERGRSFSGGQRQRLALVRVLLMDPEFLVLVEPTSAVDTHTEGRIARGLREARGERGTVVATTSPLLLERADEVFYVAGGAVVARGNHDELLDADAAYRTLILRGNDT
ncbi:MAG TPA: ABC transporter ATP-binding protein [Acidimicrobiales bacterium]|nr:ABC transporter ATP-binding protein [Acidimicrobiales bacterium]